MIRTIVQLPDAQAAALERAARRRGVSRAAVVREALDHLLGPEISDEDAALRRALATAGSFASGVSDLAERHFTVMRERGITDALALDQHFAEAGFSPGP